MQFRYPHLRLITFHGNSSHIRPISVLPWYVAPDEIQMIIKKFWRFKKLLHKESGRISTLILRFEVICQGLGSLCGVWFFVVQHETSKPSSRPSTQVKDYLQAGLSTCFFFFFGDFGGKSCCWHDGMIPIPSWGRIHIPSQPVQLKVSSLEGVIWHYLTDCKKLSCWQLHLVRGWRVSIILFGWRI